MATRIRSQIGESLRCQGLSDARERRDAAYATAKEALEKYRHAKDAYFAQQLKEDRFLPPNDISESTAITLGYGELQPLEKEYRDEKDTYWESVEKVEKLEAECSAPKESTTPIDHLR